MSMKTRLKQLTDALRVKKAEPINWRIVWDDSEIEPGEEVIVLHWDEQEPIKGKNVSENPLR